MLEDACRRGTADLVLCEVSGDFYTAHAPHWPDEIEKNEVIYPHRVGATMVGAASGVSFGVDGPLTREGSDALRRSRTGHRGVLFRQDFTSLRTAVEAPIVPSGFVNLSQTPAFAFTPLLDAVEALLGSLTGVLFVADAMHTQTGHAEQITGRGAHLLLQAKGNQPTLHAPLKTIPWAQIPVGDRTRDHGHGRQETRTVKAVTLHTPGGITFPHAQQVARIIRTRTVDGKTSRETAYLLTSLPAAEAQPADLHDEHERNGLSKPDPQRQRCHVP
jgi:hypothetical protein